MMVPESGVVSMKRRLIDALEDLPDDATFDDVVEQLDFVYNIYIGLEQAEKGMLIPHEDVVKHFQRWE